MTAVAKLPFHVFADTPRGRNLRAAHAACEAGFPVFPVQMRLRGDTWQKVPCVSGWQNLPPRPWEQVRAEFERFPDAMPGILVWHKFIFVIDLDRHHEGKDGLEEWERITAGWTLPPMVAVRTPRGGLHLYFMAPRTVKVSNSTGAIAPGIDVRAMGGFVLAPGAEIIAPGCEQHGKRWELLPDSPPINSAPLATMQILQLVVKREPKPDAVRPENVARIEDVSTETVSAYAKAAIDGEAMKLRNAPKGTRNHQLNKSGVELFSLVDQGFMTEAQAIAVLWKAADENGSIRDDGERQFWSTVRSSRAFAKANPRKPVEFKPPSAAMPRKERPRDMYGWAASAAAQPSEAPGEDAAQDHGEDAAASDLWFDGEPVPPYPDPLVENLIPRVGVGIMAGESGSGKTTALVDLCVAVATGKAFFGRAIEAPMGVVFYAAEDDYNFPHKLQAAKIARGIDCALPIAMKMDVGDLKDPAVVKYHVERTRAAVDAMRERFGVDPGLIAIDTYGRAFRPAKPNDDGEARATITVMREFAKAFGCAVIATHHTSKQDKTEIKGAGAIRGDVDFALIVFAERDAANKLTGLREIRILKTRMGTPDVVLGQFEIHDMQVGVTASGKPLKQSYIWITAQDVEGALQAVNASRFEQAKEELHRAVGANFEAMVANSKTRSDTRSDRHKNEMAFRRALDFVRANPQWIDMEDGTIIKGIQKLDFEDILRCEAGHHLTSRTYRNLAQTFEDQGLIRRIHGGNWIALYPFEYHPESP